MSKTGLPIYLNDETNSLYKKIYGVNDKITPLVDESLIENKLEKYNSSGIKSSIATFIGKKLGIISEHDKQLYLQDTIKKHNEYLLSDSENVLEKMNTEIKKNIDKCVQLDTQHNSEEYQEFKSEAQKFIITDAFLIKERLNQFYKCEQDLQRLEMNFNYIMNEKKKMAITQKKMKEMHQNLIS